MFGIPGSSTPHDRNAHRGQCGFDREPFAQPGPHEGAIGDDGVEPVPPDSIVDGAAAVTDMPLDAF